MRRLLVANRGEIAVRVMRACRERGIVPIAVHSSIDRGALHVREADEAFEIGGPAPAESYLRIDAILEAAAKTRADAIHPGYGFLSENAGFAAACRDAGVIFVGPPRKRSRRWARSLARGNAWSAPACPSCQARRPPTRPMPGSAPPQWAIGLPVVVKASAGGGGKGMRVVTDPAALDEAIAAARREAQRAFGDGTLYVERRVDRPRHVEIQVFADAHGGCVHLFERECSIQRRHQKIVEETPSPALTPAIRARMGAAAVAAARAAGYVNAGTIEFLLEGTGDDARFYFLEMNTRLQVEHAITEAVTGVDLVHAQLAVAAGAPLPWTQEALAPRGHAIEVRLCAEDPAQGFLPQAGRLLACRFPHAPGIRVDAGVERGDAIPVQYDSLVAKIVAHAATREAAIARLSRRCAARWCSACGPTPRCSPGSSPIRASSPATSTPASSPTSSTRCWRRRRRPRPGPPKRGCAPPLPDSVPEAVPDTVPKGLREKRRTTQNLPLLPVPGRRCAGGADERRAWIDRRHAR